MAVSKIIKVSASWCAPCKQLKKELENFDLVPIIEIDAEEDEETCLQYKIRNIPALIFLNENDEEVKRHVGFISKDALEKLIKEL